jgi:hypothetical protein
MGEMDEPWFQTPIPPTPIHHHQCGIALDRTIGVSQDRIDDQATTILYQYVAQVANLGFLSVSLPI